MKINPVYVLMLIGLLVLVPLARKIQQRPTIFYGIAENQDLDLSLEYPVRVKRILIEEGQAVRAGQLLMELERANVPFLRAGLERERRQLEAEKQEISLKGSTRRNELEQAKRAAAFKLDNELNRLLAEQARNAELLKSMETVDAANVSPVPTPEIEALRGERAGVEAPYDELIANQARERQAEMRSLDVRLEQVELELQELNREEQTLLLKAPADGVIGRVNYVPGEQVDTRATLLNIYRLHPDQVTTYIPEGQLTNLAVGDSLRVSSIQEQEYVIYGQVIGLGNKIRELPLRMRRDPAIQAWGREVLLRIPADNRLMQGERVLIEQTQAR